jgi:hypothetical protein
MPMLNIGLMLLFVDVGLIPDKVRSIERWTLIKL